MASELERRAREYFKRNFFGLPEAGFKYEMTAEKIENIFQAGWKASREAANKYVEKKVGTSLIFLATLGDEPEQIGERNIWTVWDEKLREMESRQDPHDFAWVDAVGEGV